MGIEHSIYFVFPPDVVPSPETQITFLQSRGFELLASGGYAFVADEGAVCEIEFDEGLCTARDLIAAGERLLPIMQSWEGRGDNWFHLATLSTGGHYVTVMRMSHRNFPRMTMSPGVRSDKRTRALRIPGVRSDNGHRHCRNTAEFVSECQT